MVSAAILLTLGTWQMQRLAWKTALIEQIEAGLQRPAKRLSADFSPSDVTPFERVELQLAFDPTATAFLGTEVRRGEIGTILLMAARDAEERSWLTELGWIPEDRISDVRDRKLDTSDAIVVTAVPRPPRRTNFATPGADLQTGRIFAEDALIAKSYQPWVLVVESGVAEFDWLRPELLPPEVRPALTNNHLGYAITWYGLCAALIGVYIAFGRTRAKAG